MKKYYTVILLFLSYFTSLFAQELPKSSDGKAVVFIIRSEFKAIFINHEFYNNEKYIGSLKGYSYLKYECDTGKQLFWASADNTDFLSLTLLPGETYIIEAEHKFGFLKGRVKLNLINKTDDNYNFLRENIINKEPATISPEKIQKKNIKRNSFILKSLNRYNGKKQREAAFINTVNSSDSSVVEKKNLKQIPSAPITLDYNFVDFPFSKKSIDLSGSVGLITNPAMSQSLNIASSFNSLTREGLYRLMTKNASTKPFYRYSVALVDAITYLPIPLTSGWMHEEFHRAVFAKHGGYSYNEMNNFPIGKTSISVLDVSDDDLIKVKHASPQDMVRMSEAGIEGEYLLANNINKTAFFYNAKSISLTPLLVALNSSLYVILCSGKNIDKETDNIYKEEGSNIKKRDLLGLDFLSYTYDLFRPNEPYQNRGVHPSGVGIDRYIKRSQLTPSELSYLKQQGILQLINFINPISFMCTSFTIRDNKNGDDTRANLYFNHWLTAFGYDISTTALLHYNKNNYAFSFHNYVNYNKWFPGLEFETYNYMIGLNKIKKPFPVSIRIMAWVQPEEQLFFSKKAQFGGLIEAKIYYPINKYFYPYISITAKTNGWVAGNVYLEPNISSSFGIRTYFYLN